VFAASSLTEAFTTLGKRFEKLHPGTSVTFDFDASSTLAEQITQGAPADVFASASATNMTQVTGAGYATKPTTFVSNTMEIAVPPDNPAHVRALADLARSGVKVAVCDPTVPCGAVAQQVFDKAQLRVKPVTVQPDVKSTLTQVDLGEVDAGMVYVTDVRAAGSQVRGIAIPPRENASTAYPIAALPKGPNPQGGRAFVRFVLSSAGQRVLLADGFHRP
jgi:molybdate transport system substrate-binding protein